MNSFNPELTAILVPVIVVLLSLIIVFSRLSLRERRKLTGGKRFLTELDYATAPIRCPDYSYDREWANACVAITFMISLVFVIVIGAIEAGWLP